jgi:hypothetical protein
MATLSSSTVALRPCSFCGKQMPAQLNRCPHCREEVPEVRLARRAERDGKQEMRRGLLYMLLGGVIYYFVAGYSGMNLPEVLLHSVLVVYLSQFLFLAGLGLFVYGCYLKMRS